jgi:uncharacterized protein (DUF362 family)/Pyruvate/2-oxoacid:ferredoxin oxidoreductase delta subunit
MIQSVVKTSSYDPEILKAAVARHFDHLSISGDLRPGMKVAIKPNLLMPSKPENAVVTNPALVSAIIEWLREHGVDDIVIAESSGGPYTAAMLKLCYSRCGYSSLSSRAALNMNTSYRLTGPRGGGEGSQYNIIAPLLDADYIINVPKLKTHSFVTLTLGVKNLMGAVPGLQKPQLHARFRDKNDFASMLIDVAAIVAPQLTIVDAVDCMEGNGPSAGTKRRLGLTLASRDVFTQDWYIARLIGVSPDDVPTIALSERRSLARPGEISLMGDEAQIVEEPFILPDAAKPNFASGVFNFLGKPAMYIANKMSAPRPVLSGALCSGCGKCAESCPVKIITIADGKAEFKQKGCIECFCCQEMCPEKAIQIKRRLNL